VGGWVDGWMGGWVEGKAGLRIAYSNQKLKKMNKIDKIKKMRTKIEPAILGNYKKVE
jgi:hypothetical protein